MTTRKNKQSLRPNYIPAYSGNPTYGIVSQNNALNQASRLNSKRNSKPAPFNQQEIKSEAITAMTSASKLGVAEAQMLDYVILKYNEQPNHDGLQSVSFTLKEYKADFGKSDSKSARKRLKDTLDNLVGTSYSYSGGDPKNPKKSYNPSFGKHNLIEGYDYNHGKAVVNLTNFFHQLLITSTMPMPYHRLAFKLNPYKEGVAFSMLRELEVNKRTNNGSGRADRMKIKTLLGRINSLPTYEEVMDTNRHVYDRIIDPFFNALERLSNEDDGAIVNYSLIAKDGKPLDYTDLEYKDFIESTLVVEWKDYPDEQVKRWSDKKLKMKQKAKKSGQKKKTTTKK